MQKLFSHRFSQNIWRIMPDTDPDSDWWAVELRDAATRSVSFAVVSPADAQVIWQGQVAGADWWSSLTAFSRKRLYLHQYRYPELPEPTDLICISATDGKMLWELPNFILVKVLDEVHLEVAAKRGDSFEKYECNAETGQIAALKPAYAGALPAIILKEPVRYKEGNPYFGDLAAFVSKVGNGQLPAHIDYLEKRPYMMFSYYIYEQEKVVQYLLIVNNQREKLLHEKLSEGREGIGRSTMLLKDSTLVFLKNNNEFSSLTLPV